MHPKQLGFMSALVLSMFVLGCQKPPAETAAPPPHVLSTFAPDADDYALAEQWLPENILKLVKNVSVEPHWLPGSRSFWYRRENADGFEFVEVDAETGDKKPLFDHQALAAALTTAGVASAEASALPFNHLELDADRSAITLPVEGKAFRCELAGYTCSAQKAPAEHPGVLVSPDGAWGVRTIQGNLYRVDMATGEESALTEDGEPHNGYGLYYGNWYSTHIQRQRAGGDENFPPMASEWAPDSRHVLVSHLDERHVEPYPFLVTAPPDGSFRPEVYMPRIPLVGEEPATLEWYVIDTKTGHKARLNLPYDELLHIHQDIHALRKIWWGPEGQRLYAAAYGDTLKSTHFFDIGVRTGEVRRVMDEAQSPRSDFNSSSYDAVNVELDLETREFIWFSQRNGWGHLYLHDLDSGALKNPITTGDWLVRDIIRVDREKRQVYFTGAGREPGNPYFRYLYRVNLDGSGLTLLTPEPADHDIDSPNIDPRYIKGRALPAYISPDFAYLAYDYSTVTEPTRSVIRRMDDGELVATFETADASALLASGWEAPDPFVAKAADGTTDIYGVLYTPAGLDVQRQYPVVDAQYASPLVSRVPHNFKAGLTGRSMTGLANSLSALGFASVVVDARGTTYRSTEFSHHSWKNLHQIGLDDHVAAIEALGEQHHWLDLGRVGIFGASYGGFTTFRAMLDFGDFFKVGVALVPPAIMYGLYPDYHWEAFHGEAAYGEGSQQKPTPASTPVNWENADGVAEAGDLKGKLMIMIGEIDENVFPASTMIVVDKLIKLGKRFDMMVYPNSPHGLPKPHAYQVTLDYLIEHLHGVQPPDYTFQPKGEEQN